MKIFLLGLIAGTTLLSSCEFESYREYRTPAYEGIFTWTELTKKADWPNRLDHTSLWYNNRLWVIGGYNPGANRNLILPGLL